MKNEKLGRINILTDIFTVTEAGKVKQHKYVTDKISNISYGADPEEEYYEGRIGGKKVSVVFKFYNLVIA